MNSTVLRGSLQDVEIQDELADILLEPLDLLILVRLLVL
jgi:hypothetical protein